MGERDDNSMDGMSTSMQSQLLNVSSHQRGGQFNKSVCCDSKARFEQVRTENELLELRNRELEVELQAVKE